jgi:hypothetical protein
MRKITSPADGVRKERFCHKQHQSKDYIANLRTCPGAVIVGFAEKHLEAVRHFQRQIGRQSGDV